LAPEKFSGAVIIKFLMNVRCLLRLIPLCVAGTAFSQSVDFNFSDFGTSVLSFASNGGMTFTPNAGGYSFQINGSATDPGLDGMQGMISGPFQVALGSITTISTNPSIQVAPVTGTGTFSIFDGTSTLTGSVTWVSASVVGTLGSLNAQDTPNLSNFSYSGTNAALLALAGDGSATASATFQVTSQSLSQLPTTVSYSGSLSAIPEPQDSAAIFGVAVFAAAMLKRKAKRVAA
jgi:hypothetical protein